MARLGSLVSLMMILGVSQLGVMIFFFPSVYASALWFSLSIFLMMLSVGKYAVNLFQESSLNFLFLLFLWAAVGVLVRAEPYAVVSWIRKSFNARIPCGLVRVELKVGLH